MPHAFLKQINTLRDKLCLDEDMKLYEVDTCPSLIKEIQNNMS